MELDTQQVLVNRLARCTFSDGLKEKRDSKTAALWIAHINAIECCLFAIANNKDESADDIEPSIGDPISVADFSELCEQLIELVAHRAVRPYGQIKLSNNTLNAILVRLNQFKMAITNSPAERMCCNYVISALQGREESFPLILATGDDANFEQVIFNTFLLYGCAYPVVDMVSSDEHKATIKKCSPTTSIDITDETAQRTVIAFLYTQDEELKLLCSNILYNIKNGNALTSSLAKLV